MIIVDGEGGGVSGGASFVPPEGSSGLGNSLNDCDFRAGTLMAFGSNKGGQLGTGDIVDRLRPSGVTCGAWRRGAGVCDVSCGMHHTLAVAAVGSGRPLRRRVYAWGWGEHGRLGVGHEEIQCCPTEVALLSHRNIVAVEAGEQHSLARGEAGDVYSWGCNRFGQLGLCLDGNTLPLNLLPQKVVLSADDGGGGEAGDGQGGEYAVSKISAGSRHSAVVTTCGKVMMWGWGEEGQLGNGGEHNGNRPTVVRCPAVGGVVGKAVGVALGISHSVVLLENERAASGGFLDDDGGEEDGEAEELDKGEVEDNKESMKKKQEEEERARLLRLKQIDFARKMEAQARQAQAELEEREQLLIRQQADLERRRMKDRETMKRFEQRKANIERQKEEREQKETAVKVTAAPAPPTTAAPPAVVDVAVAAPVSPIRESGEENRNPPSPAKVKAPDPPRCATSPTQPSNNVKFESKFKYDQIYYHPDQPVEKCFVANSARRAMLRKIQRRKSGGGAKGFDKNVNGVKTKLRATIAIAKAANSRTGGRMSSGGEQRFEGGGILKKSGKGAVRA